MEKHRVGFRGLMAVVLALSGAVACGDDSSSDNGAETQMDAGTSSDAGTNPDSSTKDASESNAQKNIVETAVAAGSFKTLAKALTDTGLDQALSGAGPFTVFAPTDEAFAKLPAGTLDKLTKEQLADILKYHVVGAKVLAKDVKAGPVTMLNGISAFLGTEGGVTINNAKVTSADVLASNGVIHVIDTVILPPNLAEAATYAGFKTLVKAATDTGVAPALTNKDASLTVFAPTDAAFAKLPAGTLEGLTKEQLADILKYHVVGAKVLAKDVKAGPVAMLNGISAFLGTEGGVTINGAKVTTADVVATNGVIHVIDAVITPPNLVGAAQLAGSFKTLVKAVGDAGLADALSAPNANLTVFAPTDAAFAALPAGTLEGLSKAQLADVLKYHVVSGKVLSKDLKAGDVDTLLTGKKVTVSLTNGVTVNTSKVVIADVVTTNGIIHVIDKVLLPPN